MAPGPRAEGLQDRKDVRPGTGQRIAISDGTFLIRRLPDEPIALEPLEAVGEDVGGDPLRDVGELVVPRPPGKDGAKDDQGPLVAEQIERRRDGARRAEFGVHRSILCNVRTACVRGRGSPCEGPIAVIYSGHLQFASQPGCPMKAAVKEGSDLVDRLRAILGDRDVTEQRMFGGVCFMLNGNMVVGTLRNELLVRVGKDANDAALRRPHARQMEMSRPAPGYVIVANAGTDRDADLKE